MHYQYQIQNYTAVSFLLVITSSTYSSQSKRDPNPGRNIVSAVP